MTFRENKLESHSEIITFRETFVYDVVNHSFSESNTKTSNDNIQS